MPQTRSCVLETSHRPTQSLDLSSTGPDGPSAKRRRLNTSPTSPAATKSPEPIVYPDDKASDGERRSDAHPSEDDKNRDVNRDPRIDHIATQPLSPSSAHGRWLDTDTLIAISTLSIEVLEHLSKLTVSEVLSTSGARIYQATDKSFSKLLDSFRGVRSAFPLVDGSSFLSSTQLQLAEPLQSEILRRANLATFFSDLYNAKTSLSNLEKHSLDTFVPMGGRLLKTQGQLFLELKTQAFLSDARDDPDSTPQFLERYFPDSVGQDLLAKRPDSKVLVSSERDFLQRLRNRRETIEEFLRANSLQELSGKYRWDSLLREAHIYLKRNIESLTPATPTPAAEGGRLVPSKNLPNPRMEQMEGQFSIQDTSGLIVQYPPRQSTTTYNTPPAVEPRPPEEDFVAKAARAAQIALKGPNDSFHFSRSVIKSPSPPQAPTAPVGRPPLPTQTIFQHYEATASPRNPPNTPPTSPNFNKNEIPHPSQTAPTHVLYDRARRSTHNRSPLPSGSTTTTTQSPSVAVLSSTRRPWSTEEESTLMAGLDRVRGPHWAKILALYGAGGMLSETLKDRNQVQLKDKARNLKLFFLKSATEVPHYLNRVTGDLRTRAPGREEKKQGHR